MSINLPNVFFTIFGQLFVLKHSHLVSRTINYTNLGKELRKICLTFLGYFCGFMQIFEVNLHGTSQLFIVCKVPG